MWAKARPAANQSTTGNARKDAPRRRQAAPFSATGRVRPLWPSAIVFCRGAKFRVRSPACVGTVGHKGRALHVGKSLPHSETINHEKHRMHETNATQQPQCPMSSPAGAAAHRAGGGAHPLWPAAGTTQAACSGSPRQAASHDRLLKKGLYYFIFFTSSPWWCWWCRRCGCAPRC